MNKVFAKAANLVLLFFMLVPGFARAVNISSARNYQANVSASTANVGTAISLQIRFIPDGRGCGGSISDEKIVLSVSGGAVLTPSTIYPTAPLVNMEAANYTPVSINSTTAGTKAISGAFWCTADNPSLIANLELGSVTFNAVPANSANGATTQNRSTTQLQTQNNTTQTPPAVPVLESLRVGNTQFAADKILENKFKQDEKKIFSGKAIANGKVTLYFQSEPFEATATADKDGNWTYELTKDLGEGEHTLQIAVTDPVTNLTSDKSQPVKFTLIAAARSENQTQTAKTNDYTWWYVGGGIVAVILAGVLGFLIYRRKKISKKKDKIVDSDKNVTPKL